MVEVSDHDLWPGFSVEGVNSGESIVVNATNGIHVGAEIELCAFKLLWGHEKDRTKDGVFLVDRLQRRFGAEFCQSKVDDFHLKFTRREPGEHDVSGLEVAVDQSHVLSGDEGLLCLQREFSEVLPCEARFFYNLVNGLAIQ